ncbi:hypothetical protein C2G38_2302563 [Gigaspora rosea]|uniref:Uncharacterized protein n=1 Tax=Gigaspora rosea TaxID=44941 RepID=A0A397TSZ2_9GLOM|nr:hypothetical protein C2G38_2302563 [Gigaspora rosea]
MSGLSISIIIDKKDRTLPKPFNNRPGYDMRYVQSHVLNYCGYGGEQLERLYATERLYDNLSIIRQDKNLIQWAVRVRINLQDLLLQQKFSVYHRFCLFASYPGEREPSNAQIAWNSLANDNTPNEKKFLGLTPCKVKNPISLDQIKMRLNKEYGEYIKKYNRLPYIAEFEISRYQEYIIPYDWIGRKKNQLRNRFQERHLELET